MELSEFTPKSSSEVLDRRKLKFASNDFMNPALLVGE